MGVMGVMHKHKLKKDSLDVNMDADLSNSVVNESQQNEPRGEEMDYSSEEDDDSVFSDEEDDDSVFSDEEDDDSVSSDEEDDVNKQFKNKQRHRKRRDQEKGNNENEDNEEERTVFVGNVPLETSRQELTRLFKQFGVVQSVRFRNAPIQNPAILKKVAVIRKKFHKDRRSMTAFVIFKEKTSAEECLKLNGQIFKNHRLRVDASVPTKPPDTCAIFVGNLDFKAEDDDLWNAFSICGAIDSVRIVRDNFSSMCKGFGYVNFKSPDSVQLALELNDLLVNGRTVRIAECNTKLGGKLKSLSQERALKRKLKAQKERLKRGLKTKQRAKFVAQIQKIQQVETAEPKKHQYQGILHEQLKKKSKKNKGELMKKKLIRKIAPRE